MNNSVIVSLRDIVVEFDGQRILDGLNLDIHDKEFVTLLGSSGCGKTTTLRLIAGFLEPTSGKVLLKGEDITGVPPYKRPVNTVFQKYALFPHLNVFENVAFGLRLKKMDEETIRRKVRDMLEVVGLKGFERRSIGQMSGGQQQRVALARILVNEPDILLLDEPFSALDSYLKEKVMTELKDLLRQFPKDVVLVTHSRDEAYQLCQSIAVLDDGRVSACAPTKELFADPQSRAAAVLTGCKNIVAARKAGPTAVFIPSWQITLQTGRPVCDDLCAIGIRGHAFCGGDGENARPIVVTEEIEQPFEWIVKFRYAHQEGGTPDIWWRFAKPDRPAVLPDCLTVDGQAILLLYR